MERVVCVLCGRNEETDNANETSLIPGGEWQRIWYCGNRVTCSVCRSKLVMAVVPGVGVHLVSLEMVQARQAFIWKIDDDNDAVI